MIIIASLFSNNLMRFISKFLWKMIFSDQVFILMCSSLNINMSSYLVNQKMGCNFHNGQELSAGLKFDVLLFYLLSLPHSCHSFDLCFYFFELLEEVLLLKKHHFALSPSLLLDLIS